MIKRLTALTEGETGYDFHDQEFDLRESLCADHDEVDDSDGPEGLEHFEESVESSETKKFSCTRALGRSEDGHDGVEDVGHQREDDEGEVEPVPVVFPVFFESEPDAFQRAFDDVDVENRVIYLVVDLDLFLIGGDCFFFFILSFGGSQWIVILLRRGYTGRGAE